MSASSDRISPLLRASVCGELDESRSNEMASHVDTAIREQLVDRRRKLETAIAEADEPARLTQLLQEVDAALDRISNGSYGLCEECHDPIETDRLMADPLVRFCLDHLTTLQQRALEEDLELASRIQTALLPKTEVLFGGWHASYHYEPAGMVSGDYCDLVTSNDGSLYFMLGDVSGKGVAASMLMAHLHAMLRALISLRLPLSQLIEHASRVFCESTLPTQYATLVCGRATESGEVEICNAGHIPPVLIQRDQVKRLEATGLPIGLFYNERFSVDKVRLAKNDTLILYTDGVSETTNGSGGEYGVERVARFAVEHHPLPSTALINAYVEDLRSFRAAAPRADDSAIMAIQRV